MQYKIPMVFDRNSDEVRGLFTLYTSVGSIVIIFSKPTNLNKFIACASKMISSKGLRVAYSMMDKPSFTEVVNQLCELDPSLKGTVTFLPDTDPLSDHLLVSIDKEWD